MSSSALDHLDEVIDGTTNDELIELTNRVFEELADRVGNVSRLALDEADRDLINEAAVFASSAGRLVPSWLNKPGKRATDATRYIDDCKKQLAEAIAERATGAQPARWRSIMIGSTPAQRRAEEKKRDDDARKGAELLATVDLSAEAVLAAFRQVVKLSGKPVQLREVALALCPEAEPADTPGRQALINRVSAVVRKLSLDGHVVKASGASYEKRVTCRWALPAGEKA